MKKVILLRSNPVNPDPLVEKMACVLLEFGHNVAILAWDRDDDYKTREIYIDMKTIPLTIFI